jgi:menaquinone-9 beta-reductase
MVTADSYDIITVGGGLAGAAFARAMAENGKRVLVLERETQFKDRIRGEVLTPWGVAELRELGFVEEVTRAFASEVSWFDTYFAGNRMDHRDLRTTSKQRLPALNWVHSEMEEVLLRAASIAGAEVRRGARVTDVKPGRPPEVLVEHSGRVDELHARLVVCADGRRSAARRWAGFEEKEDSYGMLLGGVLLDTMPLLPTDANHWLMAPATGNFSFIAPQSGGRVRAYTGRVRERGDRFQGVNHLQRFVEDTAKAGAPPEWFGRCRAIGPLATFDGTDNWVDHSYRD